MRALPQRHRRENKVAIVECAGTVELTSKTPCACLAVTDRCGLCNGRPIDSEHRKGVHTAIRPNLAQVTLPWIDVRSAKKHTASSATRL
jgi:hypothetical protein